MKYDSKRSSKYEKTVKNKIELQPQRNKISFSASKMTNRLSLSFYDQHTLRNNKQVILDNYLEDGFVQFCTQSITLTPHKPQGNTQDKKIEHPCNKSTKDQIDFTTTQASKRLNDDEEKLTRKKKSLGTKIVRPKTKEKGTSLGKIRKQLIADSLQLRLKMSPNILEKREGYNSRRY